MDLATLIQTASLFIAAPFAKADAIAKFGKVVTEERTNVHLDPLPQWHARRITLELSKLASGDEYLAGVIFEFDPPVTLSPAGLRKAWGDAHEMPVMKPDQPEAVRFDLPPGKWTGHALLSYHGDLAGREIKVERVILRRFEPSPRPSR